jgi:hypothetical protein
MIRLHKSAEYLSPIRVAVLLASMVALSTPAQSAGRLPIVSPNGSPVALKAFSQGQVFDPAATQFFSALSYNAMSVIAPIIYGDFSSPTALSRVVGANGAGPMQETQGFDPAVTAVLNGMLQQGLLPGGGWAEAAEFGLGWGGAGGGSSEIGFGNAGVASNGIVVGMSGGIPTISAGGALPTISKAGGVHAICSDDELERRLQTGGGFWNAQRGAAPIQFPPGVFSGGELGNPLGNLGPQGNPSNLRRPGPAGGWCRPPTVPFSETSPLASHTFWIPTTIVFVAVLVFWLSRGIKMPSNTQMSVRLLSTLLARKSSPVAPTSLAYYR